MIYIWGIPSQIYDYNYQADHVFLFFSPGLNKRGGDVSVSELAQILNNLKSRNAEDDGVKLQSLRFGK